AGGMDMLDASVPGTPTMMPSALGVSTGTREGEDSGGTGESVPQTAQAFAAQIVATPTALPSPSPAAALPTPSPLPPAEPAPQAAPFRLDPGILFGASVALLALAATFYALSRRG
ncbi:MAG: hypothetical protein JW910_11800, partial [Anaerolineae bacterium]|nr:hypothetical protein [Anaerolineae bacterium]